MDSVQRIGRSIATGAYPPRDSTTSPGHRPPAPTGRALVPLAAPERLNPERGEPGRSSAEFLAQLIAARHHLPQARERRRAEPREAIAAYLAAARAA